MTGTPGSTIRLTALLGDFRLLVILFIAFRLLMLMTYQPIIVDGVERGVGAGGDRAYHYDLATLSEEGLLPFRDWWSEFPPVWFLTTTTVYQLLGDNVNYTGWSMALGLLMLASEVGVLVLVCAIGTRLHGPNTGMALAWVYAITFAPLAFMWWNFDSLVALLLLLGLHWLLREQDTRSALAVAVGALTKFVPALLFGAVLRFREPVRALRYIAIAVAMFTLAYLPLFAQNAEMTTVSLTAQFGKPSYQTVWALLDGNYTTGNFGALETHLYPDGVNEVEGNPAVVPSWLRLGLALAIGLFVFVRTRRFDKIGLVAFVGITVLIFYLGSQGWSPQWLTQIIPLVLLVFPTKNGVLVTVILSLVVFAEYPFLFIRTGDSGGVITGALRMPFIILVLTRTVILASLCVAFYNKLRQEPVPEDIT